MSDQEAPRVLFDFANLASVDAWAPIDERVMGGISKSRIRSAPAARGLTGAQSCFVEAC